MSFLSSSAFSCWRTRRCAITASSRPRTRSRIASSRISGTWIASNSPAPASPLPPPPPHPPPPPADLPQAAHLPARLGERHVDRLLVHVHPHKNLARLFHGPSPFSVFAPPCQTCGSARPSRNPRYRGGGRPPLERKPFCLGGRPTDLGPRG